MKSKSWSSRAASTTLADARRWFCGERILAVVLSAALCVSAMPRVVHSDPTAWELLQALATNGFVTGYRSLALSAPEWSPSTTIPANQTLQLLLNEGILQNFRSGSWFGSSVYTSLSGAYSSNILLNLTVEIQVPLSSINPQTVVTVGDVGEATGFYFQANQYIPILSLESTALNIGPIMSTVGKTNSLQTVAPFIQQAFSVIRQSPGAIATAGGVAGTISTIVATAAGGWTLLLGGAIGLASASLALDLGCSMGNIADSCWTANKLNYVITANHNVRGFFNGLYSPAPCSSMTALMANSNTTPKFGDDPEGVHDESFYLAPMPMENLLRTTLHL